MGVTTNSNNLSVVHASSSGIAMTFPDVCKTPTPAGPIPIPYPNIAKSGDTADGSSTVKVDGNPIMLKASNYSTSSGDEAGSAQGVVSSKIKGKAEPVLYSMDVKVDGGNAYRLTDPMKANEGGSPNGAAPVTVQGPVLGMPVTSEPCKKTKSEKTEQSKKGTQWGASGIIGKHRGPIQSAATTLKVVLYIRATKAVCGPWIGRSYQPKPHSCIAGTTIVAAAVPAVQAWLNDHFTKLDKGQAGSAPSAPPTAAGGGMFSRTAAVYVGIIGIKKGAGIQPLRADDSPVNDQGPYTGKWMTADYDLFQVLFSGGGCKKVIDGGPDFNKLLKLVNSNCGWDAIQHGPQAQWVPNEHDFAAGTLPFDMNKEVAAALKSGKVDSAIKFHPKRKPMPVIDSPLAVVAGDGVVSLDSKAKVADALICQECDK